jgi:hypothetical protein
VSPPKAAQDFLDVLARVYVACRACIMRFHFFFTFVARFRDFRAFYLVEAVA